MLVVLSAAVSAATIVEAARDGDLAGVKSILAEDPAQLKTTDENKYTALHWACMRARWDVAEYLVARGAPLNVQGGDGGTPLNWLVHHDNVKMVDLLVKKGASLNVQNQWGMTELHTAIWRGCIHVVEYLLDHGADPMIKTREGWTAMHYAFRSGHDDVIELLKSKGLSLDVQDNDGRYPRHLYFKKPVAVKLSTADLDEYVGKYYIGDYLLLEIWREGDVLKVMEFGPDEIYPVARDFFYFRQAPWTLIFTRDEAGKLLHAQLSFIRRSYTIARK
jgi:ankyrin repeat protein